MNISKRQHALCILVVGGPEAAATVPTKPDDTAVGANARSTVKLWL